ncbi:hypothetical protein BP6252_09047 [Coleophoma cylindrospora]|uniref:Uncharacterized protein n=1 Tax=Coleophoma cylindrospora TaxID=1849047 RepID=A0A3D8R160_9HELO|nr:hypothetical protein BP6252_09047 [Coleophoma cylindrospora]
MARTLKAKYQAKLPLSRPWNNTAGHLVVKENQGLPALTKTRPGKFQPGTTAIISQDEVGTFMEELIHEAGKDTIVILFGRSLEQDVKWLAAPNCPKYCQPANLPSCGRMAKHSEGGGGGDWHNAGNDAHATLGAMLRLMEQLGWGT